MCHGGFKIHQLDQEKEKCRERERDMRESEAYVLR